MRPNAAAPAALFFRYVTLMIDGTPSAVFSAETFPEDYVTWR